MYFPYIRGKQFDLIALRETMHIINQGHVTPIIEPVKLGNSSLKSYAQLKDGEMPFIFVVNPSHGEDLNRATLRQVISALRESERCLLGFLIDGRTTMAQIETFFNNYEDAAICIIHENDLHPDDIVRTVALSRNHANVSYHIFNRLKVSEQYPNNFRDWDRVLIEDGFNRHNALRNADFVPDEFFSDLHATYRNLDFTGFGDFLVVGDKYFDTGGPAYAVTIHLTYLRPQEGTAGQVRMKHFVSDRTTGHSDEAGKFMEALRKLVRYVNADPTAFRSEAVTEFLDLHRRRHHPKLGRVKCLSLRHHIELMSHIVSTQ